MKGNVLKFDFYYRDILCSHVEADFGNELVSCEDFIDIPVMTVFGVVKPSIDGLNDFFKDRVFSESRPDLDVLLGLLGLRMYNPLDICRKTHGRTTEDDMWIKFEGEDLDWEKVKIQSIG